MLDFNFAEMAVVAVVALVVIGPKDLPKALRVAGYWIGKARGVARQFRSGFDEMIREAELAEMEKKWQAENERIMREHPVLAPSTPVLPDVTVDAGDDVAAPVMVEKPVVEPADPYPGAVQPHHPDVPTPDMQNKAPS
jgi:sec-independent protein translocase protein TatB